MYTFRTSGTCSKAIHLNIQDGIIKDCAFDDGCDGNAQGISRLVVGHTPEEIIPMLRGIQCRNGTSCPDQLAIALEQWNQRNA